MLDTAQPLRFMQPDYDPIKDQARNLAYKLGHRDFFYECKTHGTHKHFTDSCRCIACYKEGKSQPTYVRR